MTKAKQPNDNLLASGPICIGTGLLALDWILNDAKPDEAPAIWAGGSCGNVLTILSYLGWRSYPIARLGRDVAAKYLLDDLHHWDVCTSFVSQESTDHTPIIVQRVGTGYNGQPWHRFEWVCPNCGAALPRYKPVLLRQALTIIEQWEIPQVFYFDRVVPSTLRLVAAAKEQGALIFFEPSAIKDEKMFAKCLQMADIIKYSHDRLGHIPELAAGADVWLQIETLGAQGLRYRIKQSRSQWQELPAYPVANMRDASGAGDWCSAGLLSCLIDTPGTFNRSLRYVEDALRYGQVLSAINCQYHGARGAMYFLTKKELDVEARRCWDETTTKHIIRDIPLLPHPRGLCSICTLK